MITEEVNYIRSQITKLQKYDLPNNLKITYDLKLTMIDAKICNALTDTTSTMRCYICGAASKDFNDLQKMAVQQLNHDAIEFGLSVLHARIRFLEFVLRLAYKLPLKKWQARSDSDKEITKGVKQRIQEEFRHELGILVDIPKAGFGTTNDGNTSRRFFSNVETSARITGVDLAFLKKLRLILELISSGKELNIQKFSTLCSETAELYISLYDWYPMSPTVHKILIHGPTVIQHAILPIGQLSEEAAECRHKHFREYRNNFARKSSRTECNRDVLNRLLLTSDPLISSLSCKQDSTAEQFSDEAFQYFEEASDEIDMDEE